MAKLSVVYGDIVAEFWGNREVGWTFNGALEASGGIVILWRNFLFHITTLRKRVLWV